ncbi:WXG100 family type VII secretion target [Anaerocolumna sp. AGMB13020]|uniref:WXG100 family type VII secretion target n=1 Tax=Anaerocolumna sp. AGMB13020 TaxID=3081750 RepID=UPI002953D458|nr:WXG100 family type VII secretion target [Anaerocolumna sp. AGMB13020]WOO37830.1 WXG100 family type VII secretion target [Anaerocolumna sp. AGMB13020]
MLKINEEMLNRTKLTYQEQAQRMIDLKAKLSVAVEDIKDGWDTQAGDAFFEKYGTEWEKNISTYIEVIQIMSRNMQIADSKYQSVYETAQRISLD